LGGRARAGIATAIVDILVAITTTLGQAARVYSHAESVIVTCAKC
jgi:hypothetical protein